MAKEYLSKFGESLHKRGNHRTHSTEMHGRRTHKENDRSVLQEVLKYNKPWEMVQQFYWRYCANSTNTGKEGRILQNLVHSSNCAEYKEFLK